MIAIAGLYAIILGWPFAMYWACGKGEARTRARDGQKGSP